MLRYTKGQAISPGSIYLDIETLLHCTIPSLISYTQKSDFSMAYYFVKEGF